MVIIYRDVAPRRSWCFSLVVWLCAPLLLSVVSAFTFPAFTVLAVLLLCMKVSMLFENFGVRVMCKGNVIQSILIFCA